MLWDIGHATAETEHEICTVWMISGNLLTTSWELEDDADLREMVSSGGLKKNEGRCTLDAKTTSLHLTIMARNPTPMLSQTSTSTPPPPSLIHLDSPLSPLQLGGRSVSPSYKISSSN
jgi:hypothetical protein